jgi:hypothetical protein
LTPTYSLAPDLIALLLFSQVNRRALSVALNEASCSTGTRSWRSLMRRLLETDSFFGAPARQAQPTKIYWKLDPTENSSRQRKRLVRNYKGSDHFGAAADYQDPQSLAAVAAAAARAAKKAEAEGKVKELDTPLALEAAKLAPVEGFQEGRAEEERPEGGGERGDTISGGGDTASVTSDGPHSVTSTATSSYGSAAAAAAAAAAATGPGAAAPAVAPEGPLAMAAATPSPNEKVKCAGARECG